ncbi:MAG: Rep family protein [Corynebacterium sp.]|uniref:Rep family protein n=1 Tax=Corynebacterium sp. TaxID=1720 RepID=UPI003F01315E
MSKSKSRMPLGRKPSKHRYFMLVVQSDDERIEAVIAGLKQRWHAESIRAAYIEHDRDRDVDPHYHIVIAFKGPVSRDDVARYLGVKRAMVRVLTGGEKGLARYLRYLTHEDPDPDVTHHGEHLYDHEQVRANFDWEGVIRNATLSKTRSPKLRDVQLMLIKTEVTVDDVMDKWPELYVRHQTQIDKMSKAGEARQERLAEQAKQAQAEAQSRRQVAAEAAEIERKRQEALEAEQAAKAARERQEVLEEMADEADAAAGPDAIVDAQADHEDAAERKVLAEEAKVDAENDRLHRERIRRDADDSMSAWLYDQGLDYDKMINVIVEMEEIGGWPESRKRDVEQRLSFFGADHTLEGLARYFVYLWDDLEDEKAKDIEVDDIKYRVHDMVDEQKSLPVRPGAMKLGSLEMHAAENHDYLIFMEAKALREDFARHPEWGIQSPVDRDLKKSWRAELQAIANRGNKMRQSESVGEDADRVS